ncbi:MAG TPA: protein kinase [Terriglobales bacterium]|nr:protein kinase [Terriglobales bacterium]
MALSPGTRLGPYQIVSALGAGGMGEVYRARDTRLEREVAIKVLTPSVGFSSDLKQRFEREARAISSLNHPHICTLFDVGHENGTDYLVMELLEGQSLAERLARGPLPLEQVLTYGEQIADALERAHRQGIVHRDLKPGNVMLTKAGAKLLDFGLAKPVAQHVAVTGEFTRSHPITAEGSIVGTYQYMSPEQIDGREADRRSDIFAFGAMLYEMATGKKAFEGKSPISIASAILEKDPPPISTVQPVSPPGLDRVVQSCLAKDPEMRWQSAHDVKLELGFVRAAAPPRAVAAGRARGWMWASGALLAVVLALLAFAPWKAAEAPHARQYRSSLLPPRGHSYVAYDFALSPDATRLAFTGTSADGVTTLWMKNLGTDANQEFSGTEGATYPFWSPDSRYVAFFTAGKLNKVDTTTGAIQPVASAAVGRGGSWGADGSIVFVASVGLPLQRVHANGGALVNATEMTPGTGNHRWPTFLPDGKHFLFVIDWSANDGLYLASIDDPKPVLVAKGLRGNTAFANGHVLFVQDGTLYAQRFDMKKLRLEGDPIPVVNQELETDTGFSRSGFSASESGTLVYQSRGSYSSRLVWFDRTGKEFEAVGPASPYHPALSPDGKRLALTLDSANDGHMRVHVLDLERGTITAIAPDTTRSEAPVWSPDGSKVAYVTRDEGSELQVRSADGAGRPESLRKSLRLMTTDWSPDGRYLMYMDFPHGMPQLWIHDLQAGKDSAIATEPSAEGRFSPDGKWVSYTTSIAGGPVIFVQPFPGPGPLVQVSAGSGTQSHWSADGKFLYYVSVDKELMEVAVSSGRGGFQASAPRRLFRTRMHSPRYALFQYDVSKDGKRFLINSLPREDAAAPLTLVTDWTALGK